MEYFVILIDTGIEIPFSSEWYSKSNTLLLLVSRYEVSFQVAARVPCAEPFGGESGI